MKLTEKVTPRTTPKSSPAARYKVPNLERGLQIMELLLDYPKGLQQSEIASLLRCSKTSVFRISMTLVEYGYLVRDEETKALRLSRKLIAMGNRTLGEDDLMSTSVDVMRKLRDLIKETVLIGTVVESEFVVLGQVLGSHPFKFSLDLGTRVPIHTAAPGKAILAFLPEVERDQVLAKMPVLPDYFPKLNPQYSELSSIVETPPRISHDSRSYQNRVSIVWRIAFALSGSCLR